jgi:hypothetical protein
MPEFEHIPDFDWGEIDVNDLYPRLLLYTTKLLNRPWRGERPQCKSEELSTPGGRSADDFIYEAIQLTAEGKRNWNRAKVSAFMHLAGVIRSMVGHLYESEENKTTKLLEDSPDNIIELSDYVASPEEIAISISEIRHIYKLLDSEDPDLRRLAEALSEGSAKNNSELAEQLGMTETRVESLRRRLKRVRAKYLARRAIN